MRSARKRFHLPTFLDMKSLPSRTSAAKKRKPLRRNSLMPMRVLLKKADRALQDCYRVKAPAYCEGCIVSPANIVHHFFEKSQSAGLRFDHDNLIPLCNGCHFRHHRTGDQSVMSTVILRRGAGWHKKLMKKRLATKNRGPLSRSELQTLLEKYQPKP